MNETPTDPARPSGPSEKPKQHPVAEAAWRGYREYKEDMAKRKSESPLHRLSIPSMAITAVVLIAFFMLLDYLKRAGIWGGVQAVGGG